MKTSINKKIANYYFQDSYQLVYGTAVGNFLLVLIYLMGDITNIINNSHTLICLFSGVIFFTIHFFYNWEIHFTNILIVFIYLCIFFFEFIVFGVPNSTVNPTRFVSKGVILEFFGGLMPYIYLGFRLILTFPLIRMTYSNYQLKQISLND